MKCIAYVLFSIIFIYVPKFYHEHTSFSRFKQYYRSMFLILKKTTLTVIQPLWRLYSVQIENEILLYNRFPKSELEAGQNPQQSWRENQTTKNKSAGWMSVYIDVDADPRCN